MKRALFVVAVTFALVLSALTAAKADIFKYEGVSSDLFPSLASQGYYKVSGEDPLKGCFPRPKSAAVGQSVDVLIRTSALKSVALTCSKGDVRGYIWKLTSDKVEGQMPVGVAVAIETDNSASFKWYTQKDATISNTSYSASTEPPKPNKSFMTESTAKESTPAPSEKKGPVSYSGVNLEEKKPEANSAEDLFAKDAPVEERIELMADWGTLKGEVESHLNKEGLYIKSGSVRSACAPPKEKGGYEIQPNQIFRSPNGEARRAVYKMYFFTRACNYGGGKVASGEFMYSDLVDADKKDTGFFIAMVVSPNEKEKEFRLLVFDKRAIIENVAPAVTTESETAPESVPANDSAPAQTASGTLAVPSQSAPENVAVNQQSLVNAGVPANTVPAASPAVNTVAAPQSSTVGELCGRSNAEQIASAASRGGQISIYLAKTGEKIVIVKDALGKPIYSDPYSPEQLFSVDPIEILPGASLDRCILGRKARAAVDDKEVTACFAFAENRVSDLGIRRTSATGPTQKRECGRIASVSGADGSARVSINVKKDVFEDVPLCVLESIDSSHKSDAGAIFQQWKNAECIR